MVDYNGDEAIALAAILCISLVGVALVGLVAINDPSLQNAFHQIGYSISNAADGLGYELSQKKQATQSEAPATRSVSTPSNPTPPDNNGFNKKNGTPKNNKDQNRQVRDICKKYGLNKDQQRMLHDEIRHHNYGYHEIVEEAKAIAGLQ